MTRPGMEIIDGVEIIDHLALPRVGIKDVLEALNAARVSRMGADCRPSDGSGWD